MAKCIVTVCENMSQQTFALLTEKIHHKFGEDIIIEKKVDNTVVGGFMMDIDGHIFDLTVKTQIEELKKHFTENKEV